MSLALVAGLSLLVMALAMAAPVGAQEGHDEGDSAATGDNVAALRGAAVFATYCQACHGPTGEALGTGPAFAAIEYDADTARDIIRDGADTDMGDGAAMPAYKALLSEAELDDLIAYLDTWATRTTPPLPEPNVHVAVETVPDYFGDAHEGAVLYAKFCNGCHGPEGEGRKKPKISGFKFEPQTIQLVAQGHANVLMPAFSAAQGGPLDDQQLTDLETYMASWELSNHKEPAGTGLNSLVLIVGIGALLAIGVVYIVRDRGEAAAD
jgi:mono/diheme cytochrome c family protein